MNLKIKIGTANPDVYLYLESIYINPEKSATISYTVKDIKRGQLTRYTYEMDGEQYKKWGTDDTIIYHLLCIKHGYQYMPYIEPEYFEEVNVWRDEATGEMKTEMVKKPNPKYTGQAPKVENIPIPEALIRTDDNRSVHNDADIQKIQTLQEQLDAQALKLKTITDMLIGKGLV